MKIMITGASGLLGLNAAETFGKTQEVLGTYLHTKPPIPQAARIDLTSRHAVSRLFEEFQPHLVIHAAAMTRADQCEKDPAAARAVNVGATRHLAQLCDRYRCRLIYISTDLVFDGKKGDYVERDAPAPISHYGETKLHGEAEAATIVENHVILRVALMYGKSLSGNRGADEAIIAAQKEGQTLRLFTDEFRTPICVPSVVEALMKLAESGLTGLFHCAGAEKVSRYEFARKLAEFVRLDMKKILPVKIAEVRVVPPRAPDVSMDSSKIRSALALDLPDLARGLSLLYPRK